VTPGLEVRPGGRAAHGAGLLDAGTSGQDGRPGLFPTARAGITASPVLLAVAHGSRDPAARACVGALASGVRAVAGGVGVRAAFVQHARPLLAEALAGAVTEVGAGRVIIVPLLLSTGYHLTVDIAEAAVRAGVPVAGPLGPDARLVPALADRLAEAGVPAGTPVVLAAAGSSDPAAAADTRSQAALLGAHLRVPVVAAFASAAAPAVPGAVADLAARTGRPVAVATYLLAPGLFHGRLRHSGAAWVSAPLGDHPAVARLIADRFRAVAGTALNRAA
jgi:sirohydrochlorin ferrochelatase